MNEYSHITTMQPVRREPKLTRVINSFIHLASLVESGSIGGHHNRRHHRHRQEDLG